MTDQPHILFLLTDQQRADCLGAAGHPMLRTPHMDRLAAEGRRFTQAFTNCPLCMPARAALATGLYPHNNGFWQNDGAVPAEAETYFRRLQAAGYRTCSIGKNHLCAMENCDLYANERRYHEMGLDHIEDMSGTWGVIGGRSVYTDHLASRGLLDPLRAYLRDLEAQPDAVRRFVAEPLPIPAEDYIDAFIARRIERYLDRYDGGGPSFVVAGFQGPHEPWDAPLCYTDLYDPAQVPDPIPELSTGEWLPECSVRYHRWAQYYPPENRAALQRVAVSYYGKITQIDDSVGRILRAYERKGWLDNTVVIFASDHGEMLGDHNRLSKSVFYDSAIGIPLIIRLPGDGAAGSEHSGFAELLDLHHTILDLAGAKTPGYTDSRSLVPVLRGQTQAVRNDVLGEAHVHLMLRDHEWKIVVGRGGGTLQLFDLCENPQEQYNLCGHPDYRQQELEMRSKLLGRIAQHIRREGALDPEFSGH